MATGGCGQMRGMACTCDQSPATTTTTHLLLISDPGSRQRGSWSWTTWTQQHPTGQLASAREGLAGPANPEKGAHLPNIFSPRSGCTQKRAGPQQIKTTTAAKSCLLGPANLRKPPAPGPSSRKVLPELLSFENHHHGFYKACTQWHVLTIPFKSPGHRRCHVC